MANIKKILPSLIDSGNFTIIGDLQVSGTILQSGSVFSASDTGLATLISQQLVRHYRPKLLRMIRIFPH